MDPLSAISLAGTLVQFVDFTSKIVTHGRELYETGSLKLQGQVETVTTDLLDFSAKFQQGSCVQDGSSSATENEIALRKLCKECDEIALQLLAQLSRLKPILVPPHKPPGRTANGSAMETWRRAVEDHKQKLARLGHSLRSALIYVWSRSEILELEERLEKYRAAIQTRMLACLGNQIQILSMKQSQRFDELDRTTKQIVGALLDDIHANISEDIRRQTEALALLLNRREVVVVEKVKRDKRRRVVNLDSADASSEYTISIINSTREKEEHDRRVANAHILASLQFDVEKERYDGVAEAHARTFDWIYEDKPGREVEWDSFVEWLESGDGLYWVNGKAGSGKSTLMKYICDNRLTRKHLSTWAGSAKLSTASFYFWNLGTALQKSQAGLLRSLIRVILEDNQDLIPILFPSRWAKAYSHQILDFRGSKSGFEMESFSSSTLSKTWSIIINYANHESNNFKLALFVDGLDEFEGLDIDMAKLFKSAVTSPGVKVCVSSRPHVAYEKYFSDCPSLRLQDLTYLDITRYVEDRLVKDEGMQELLAEEPVKTLALVEEIVKSADGVFLWVYLVVTSLLKGLGNCDNISDLEKKLRLLPKDLKNLYIHMIIRVDEDYKEEAVEFFKLVNAAQVLDSDWREPKPMTMLALCLARESDEGLSALAFISKCRMQCQEASRRLKSRTGGLLEVQQSRGKLKKVTPEMKVGYLHRTVRDFLITKEVRDILQAETDFDPDHAMLKSSIYELEFLAQKALGAHGTVEDRSPLYYSALVYAKRCQAESRCSKAIFQTHLLDRLYEKAPRKEFREMDSTFDFHVSSSYECFLFVVVEWGLLFYLRDKLKSREQCPAPVTKRRLLAHALDTSSVVTPIMILDLLTSGDDPFISGLEWQEPLHSNPSITASIADAIIAFTSIASTPTYSRKSPGTQNLGTQHLGTQHLGTQHLGTRNPGTYLCSEQFLFFERVIKSLDKPLEPMQPDVLKSWAQVLRHLLKWRARRVSVSDENITDHIIPKSFKNNAAKVFARLPESEELQLLLASAFPAQDEAFQAQLDDLHDPVEISHSVFSRRKATKLASILYNDDGTFYVDERRCRIHEMKADEAFHAFRVLKTVKPEHIGMILAEMDNYRGREGVTTLYTIPEVPPASKRMAFQLDSGYGTRALKGLFRAHGNP